MGVTAFSFGADAVAMGAEKKLREVCHLICPLFSLVPHLLVSLGKDGIVGRGREYWCTH